MANIHKALTIDLLKMSRREYIYHKQSKLDYPFKNENIEYWGNQCLKYREMLKAINA